MAKFRYGWGLVLILAAIMLAACGDDDDKSQGGPLLGTPVPTSRFPPTWTPVPTNTESPRSTIDYTYEPPAAGTFPPGSFPTRAPGATPVPAQHWLLVNTGSRHDTVNPAYRSGRHTAMIKELTDFLPARSPTFSRPRPTSAQNGLVRANRLYDTLDTTTPGPCLSI
jgi:hypothetical protein